MGMTFLPEQIAAATVAVNLPGVMDGDQLAFFKMRLRSMETELLGGMDATKEIIKQVSGYCPDIVDQASKEEEAAMELMAHGRNKQALREIRSAIERINAGDYGYCEDCGIEISVQRLMASPTACSCFDCKTIQETKDRAFAQRFN